MIRQIAIFTLVAAFGCTAAPRGPLPDPAQDIDKSSAKGKQKAVFAGGCFWCTEAVFEAVAGVDKVVSGYSGGDLASAQYELVGSGRTNHAEAIEITFDPTRISYGQLLKIFCAVAHDPTQLNYQGPDHGRQYRSAVFYADAEQQKIVTGYVGQLEQAKLFNGKIVTEISPLKAFFPAEDYHQDFVTLHPTHPYVVVNSTPKVAKLKKEFPALLKK